MFFNRKYLENTLGVVINLFMALKNQKRHPKNQNQHEIKNQTSSDLLLQALFR